MKLCEIKDLTEGWAGVKTAVFDHFFVSNYIQLGEQTIMHVSSEENITKFNLKLGDYYFTGIVKLTSQTLYNISIKSLTSMQIDLMDSINDLYPNAQLYGILKFGRLDVEDNEEGQEYPYFSFTKIPRVSVPVYIDDSSSTIIIIDMDGSIKRLKYGSTIHPKDFFK